MVAIKNRSSLFTQKTPGGFHSLIDIREVPRNVWFVDASHSDSSDTVGAGAHPDAPFDKLSYAWSSNVFESGDICYVMPGHTETVNGAADIAMDIAGVKIRCLGWGSTRPTFTFDATGATITITAADVWFDNFLITSTGTTDVANAIAVTGADCVLGDPVDPSRGPELRDASATSQFDDFIIVGTGGARCKIYDPIIRSHASGDAAEAGILVSATLDGVEIWDANIDGLFGTGCIESTAAATNMIIAGGWLRNRHATRDAGINLNASNTGWIGGGRRGPLQIRSATNDANGFNLAIVGAAMQVQGAEIVVNADGERGGAWGTQSTA